MSDELELEGGRSWEQYWDIVKRRRWWLLGPAVVFWAAGLAGSYNLPAKYKSEAQILVDQPKVSAQYVTPNVTVDLQNQLHSLEDQILSRTRLLDVIKEFHLYRGTEDPDALVRQMRSDIEIEPVKSEQSSFRISYSAPNPDVAKQVAERFTQIFLDENVRKQQLSEDMTQFLETQLQEARQDLDAQEERLREFRSKYPGVLPEQLQTNVQILGGLQEQLASSAEGLNRAEQQNLYLSSILSQTKNRRSSANTLGGQLARLKGELESARSRYTEKHPDVVRLEEQVATTQRLLDKAKSATPDGANQATGEDGASDSSTLQLESQLKANNLEIAGRKKGISNLERQVANYQARLNLTPAREQEMAALMRNYNQSRANYEGLLGKKMQSQVATNLEKSQKGEQFRVLDPPSLPQRPYWPNRLLIAMGALMAGLALGAVAALLKDVMDQRIYTDRDLAEFANVRLLSVVPPVFTARDVRMRLQRSRLEMVLTILVVIIVPVLTTVAWIRP